MKKIRCQISCLLVIFVSISACDKNEPKDISVIETPAPQIDFSVEYSVLDLSESSFPIQELQQKLDNSLYDNNYGEITYDKAISLKYKDNEETIVAIIPILDMLRTTYLTSIVSFYDTSSKKMLIYISDISAEVDPAAAGTSFSGALKLKAIDNYVLVEGHYDNGITKEIITYDPNGTLDNAIDQLCAIQCFNETMNESGPYKSSMTTICKTGLSCCNENRSWLNDCCVELGSCLVATIGISSTCLTSCVN